MTPDDLSNHRPELLEIVTRAMRRLGTDHVKLKESSVMIAGGPNTGTTYFGHPHIPWPYENLTPLNPHDLQAGSLGFEHGS